MSIKNFVFFFFESVSSAAEPIKATPQHDDGILSTECFLAWLFQMTVTSHRGFHTRQLVTVTGDGH